MVNIRAKCPVLTGSPYSLFPVPTTPSPPYPLLFSVPFSLFPNTPIPQIANAQPRGYFSVLTKKLTLQFASDIFDDTVPQQDLHLHFLDQVVADTDGEEALHLTLVYFFI